MRNDYLCNITVGNVVYPSVEHAYQAAKFKDAGIKQAIADASSVREARDIGRNNQLRDDWDEVRSSVMESLVRQKFTNHAVLGERLAKTGNADIVMEGYDEFWGTGRSGNGENTLGEILETVRSEIQFLHGIDPDDYSDGDESEGSSLKVSILNHPSEQLADACQKMYVGAQELMKLVDPNDFDAPFIARRTGVGDDAAKDAIEKLQSMMSALNEITDLLDGDDNVVGVLSPMDDDDDDEEYGGDVDEHEDVWLNPMD
jgi:ribA/ribD-fused uncharacterized protein